MKIAIELKNIIGSTGDLYTEEGVLIYASYTFPNLPKELNEERKEITLNKILKLKEAGFDSDEILKMNQAEML